MTHVVSFFNLDRLPVKLCIFALLTGLEAELIRLFTRTQKESEWHLSRLSEGRILKAKEQCRLRYREKDITSERIIRATNFIDKVTMILRWSSALSLLPFDSKRKAEEFFRQLQALRNHIAHSDSILVDLETPLAFNQLLSKLRQVMEIISHLASQPPDDSAYLARPTD